jgi:arsenite methyltransferase
MAGKEERISYFEFQAEIGLTKHIGGITATRELIKLCRIKRGSKVLEVGCGVGLTSVYLAEKGCMVTGVDISKGMIRKAKEKAEQKKVKVEFIVADAHKLPFRNNVFDAVICESVMAFIPDKKKAMKEFARVTKPGGYVGITEVAWIKEPPAEMKKKMSDFSGGELRTSEEWKKLLVDARLKNVVARTHKLNMLNEAWDQIRRWDIVEYMKVHYRTWKGIFTKASYRRFIMDALKLPWNVADYWGYGVYAGRKAG